MSWENSSDWYKKGPVGAITVRSYKDNEGKRMQKEVAEAVKHGWRAEQIASQDGHLNVGKTALRVATGIGLVFGASRTKGVTMMQFTRDKQV
jgi:hypothetical protein